MAALALLLAACSKPPPDGYQGYLEADFAYVGAPVAGRLLELPVARGGVVAVGAPLFAIEAELEQHQLEEAQSRLAQAQAQRADLDKGRRPEELRVIAERAREARSALALATQELARTRSMRQRNLIAADALDRAVAAEAQARARVATVDAELASAGLAGRADALLAADAGIATAQAQVEQARWRSAQTRIAALTPAKVEDTLYQVGEWVPAGSPVVKLLPEQALYARFFVPLAELAQWQPGARVSITCSSCGEALAAEVHFVSSAPEYTPPLIFSESRNDDLVYRVEARMDAASAATLLPGLPVTVRRL
jgi:HlyD family secretion protein